MTDTARPPLAPEQQALIDELAAKLQEVLAPYVHSIESMHVALMARLPAPELITIKVLIPEHLTEEEVRAAADAANQGRAWERR